MAVESSRAVTNPVASDTSARGQELGVTLAELRARNVAVARGKGQDETRRKTRGFQRDRIASFPIKEVEGAKLGLRRFLPYSQASTLRERRRSLEEQRRFANEK